MLVAITSIALVAALMGGCAPKSSEEKAEGTGTQAAEKIKVGVHTSLTGQLADYGFAAEQGLKLAAKDLGTFKIGDKEFESELVI